MTGLFKTESDRLACKDAEAIRRGKAIVLARIATALKSAPGLNLQRAIGYGMLLGFAQTLLAAYFYLLLFGVLKGSPPPLPVDFVTFYTAGRLVDHDAGALVYHVAAFLGAQADIIGRPWPFLPFFYPPIFAAMAAPFAMLPLPVAFVAWTILTVGTLVGVLAAITDDQRLALALLSFPPIFVSIYLGQNALLTAALLGAGTIYLDRAPLLAGAIFGLICYKPHFLLILPVVLVASRNWRALAGLSISVASAAAISVSACGWLAWRDFVVFSPVIQARSFDGSFGYWAYASWFAAIRLVGGSMSLAAIGQATSTLGAATTAVLILRSPVRRAVRAMTVVASTLVAMPVMLSYDLTSGLIVVAWIIRDARRTGFMPWEKLVLIIIWIVSFIGRDVSRAMGIPLLQLIGLALLTLVVVRSRSTEWDTLPHDVEDVVAG